MSRLLRDFWKMHGAGNDFVLLDCRESPFLPKGDERMRLCDRRFGIGCDQLIEVHGMDDDHTYDLRFFNQDGSEADACGNGTRCAASWLMARSGLSTFPIRVAERTLPVYKDQEAVWVDMGAAEFTPAKIPMTHPAGEDLREILAIDGEYCAHALSCSMGNPHLVLVMKQEVDAKIVQDWGTRLEHHPLFPERVNIGFAHLQDDGVSLRVYERGVGETLACGSGACAAFAVLHRLGLCMAEEMLIQMAGGDLRLQREGDNIHMTGPVALVAEGVWHG